MDGFSPSEHGSAPCSQAAEGSPCSWGCLGEKSSAPDQLWEWRTLVPATPEEFSRVSWIISSAAGAGVTLIVPGVKKKKCCTMENLDDEFDTNPQLVQPWLHLNFLPSSSCSSLPSIQESSGVVAAVIYPPNPRLSWGKSLCHHKNFYQQRSDVQFHSHAEVLPEFLKTEPSECPKVLALKH